MDETRNRLLTMIGDPRLASDVPSDDARRLLAEITVVQGGLLAAQGALLPRALGQDRGGVVAAVDGRLLTPEEAAEIAGTTPEHLLAITRRGGQRFRRRLSHKVIRFEEGGLRRWLLMRAA